MDVKLTLGKDMGLTIELFQHLHAATNPIPRDVGKLKMNPCENLNIMHNYNKIVMMYRSRKPWRSSNDK
jgi:hypothetical protein